MQRIGFLLLLFILEGSVLAQPLSVSITATDNTDCLGRNCFYNGPTILINEVMLSPSSYDGSMVGSAYHTTGGGEWIELYNPHKCDSVDISCYFLGNNAYDNTYQSGNWPGGFVIPQGSVVPPQGFAMVRGERAAPVDPSLLVQNGGNVVEIIIDSRYCMGTGGGRLWFPNAGGWFAFYDANGVPQDAISWCDQTNSCMSCPPCNPGMSDCGYTGALASYDAIPASRKTYISSNNPQNNLGQSFRRIPDGGAWVSTQSMPTYATCNDTCVPPADPSCNAIAVAVVTGGVPPYTYQWDDNAHQTTDTAFALCAGTYTVIVTDANLDTVSEQVTIIDFQPFVSHNSSVYCLNDSSAVLSGLPAGGTYQGGDFSDNTFFFHDSAAVYSLTYTIADSNGCAASANFFVVVNQNYDILLYDTICQREPYNQYGFQLTPAQTASTGTIFLDSLYQTINQCDSFVALELFVLPSEIITYDTAICEGDFFAAYGLTIDSDTLPTGTHQFVNVYQNQFQCDSTETVNLTIHPVYDIQEEIPLCQHDIYNQNGFLFNTDTMALGRHVFVHDTISSSGCDSTFTLTINLSRSDETVLFDTICQYETYQQYNFNLSSSDDGMVGNFIHYQNLQNEFGCDSIVQLNLTITSSPIPDFITNPERAFFSNQKEIQFINITDLSGYNNGESFSWHWDYGDGNTYDSGSENTIHQYDTWGEFLVTLTVTTTEGCVNSISHSVYLEAELFFPNVITPNGDGVNDVFAIKNLNPELPNLLTIYNRWGKKVYEMENYQTYAKDEVIYNKENGFAGENLSDGVYFYTFHYVGYAHAVDYHSTLTIIR